MSRFGEMSVDGLLEALTSPDPTPGGGTAAAVVGAMGVSLLMMVAGLAKSKTNTEDERAALATLRHALAPHRAQLMVLADADTAAFDAVMAAYRQPRTTDQEKASRKLAIQSALRGATDVPLDTLRILARVLGHAPDIARLGNPTAASDAGVAIGLLVAAADGAAANVRINLGGLSDAGFGTAAGDETTTLLESVAVAASLARETLASTS